MNDFWQGLGFIILSVVLMLLLGKQGGEMTVLLSVACCCLVGVLAFGYLKDVIDFVHRLKLISKLDDGLMSVLLKAVGVGLIGEFASLICADAGNAAQSKAVQLLTSAVILWLSIPVLEILLDLLEKMLGAL